MMEWNKQLQLANSYAKTNRFTDSERLYKQIISHHNGPYEAYVGLANLYFRYQKEKEAYEVALIARNIYGSNWHIDQFLFLHDLHTCDYVSAEEVLLNTLSNDPHNASALIHYAELLIIIGHNDHQFIKELIVNAIKYGGNQPVVTHYCVQFSLLKLDYLTDLNSLLQEYFEGITDEFTKQMTLGQRFYLLKQYKDAYDHIYQAFTIRPQNTEAIQLLEDTKLRKSYYFGLRRVIEKWGGLHLYYSVLLLFTFFSYTFHYDRIGDTTLLVTLGFLLYWLSTYGLLKMKVH